MKKMKKLAALLLALVLVTAMVAMPANAADDSNIKIVDALKGVTYTVYQMLDLSFNSATDSYCYTIEDTDVWYDFLYSGEGKNYVKLVKSGTSGTYVVTWNTTEDDATKAAFAKSAAANIPDGASEAASDTPSTDGDFTFTETFGAGYYLVTSSAGTAAMVDTVTASGSGAVIEIKEKLELPSVKKSVDKETACIGDVVTFTTTVTTQANGVNYVLHDVMGDAFLFSKISSVKYNGVDVNNSMYTITTDGADDCTFEISFHSEFCDTLTSGGTIEIVYTATLTGNAVGNGTETNKNTTWLTHGANKDIKTAEATASVATYALTINKTDDNGEELAGAGFTLYDATNNPIKLYSTGNNTYSVCMTASCGIHNDAHVTEITTDKNGTLIINGLGNGTYTLKETTVPAGYVGAADETITINSDDVKVEVKNTSGTELPSTGGIGTTIFYVVGGVLVLAALVVLISKKRMAA